MSDRIPPLKSSRLSLRALQLSDVDDVFAYASNPNVTHFMTWETHRSRDDTLGFLRRVTTAPADQYNWAVREAASPTVIGAVEFSLRSASEGEVHYTFAESAWGQGYGTEAVGSVMDWAFASFPALEKVLSSAVAENRGSTRVMEKCGMSPAGTYEEFWPKHQKSHQMAIYQLERRNWESRTVPG